MALQEPAKSKSRAGRPLASSSRSSGPSESQNGDDIELPGYSNSVSSPPPSYQSSGPLFPNYRPEKQLPKVSASPAAIEEGRVAPLRPAFPNPGAPPAVAPAVGPRANPSPLEREIMRHRRKVVSFGSLLLLVLFCFMWIWFLFLAAHAPLRKHEVEDDGEMELADR